MIIGLIELVYNAGFLTLHLLDVADIIRTENLKWAG